MIDKIDGGSPYDYPKITNKRSAGIHAYDAAWQNAISEKEKQEDPGVILDIGANREKKQPEKEQPQSQKDRTETSGGGFTWEQLKASVRSMISFLKETWRTIWEDAPAEEKKDPVETTDDAEQIAAQNEAGTDAGCFKEPESRFTGGNLKRKRKKTSCEKYDPAHHL